ncbi:chromatin modification- protein VID21 [Onygenales sp. PD_12]|nr:chromatin modification- protein VID21 [Onygenales sp. PD_12]
MLRDELLQSKNDEIARCLLSRKRKLSELYFATVGFPAATGPSPQALQYRQKEQEFLDANDLAKGRFFNEGTLPPRPDVASIHLSPTGHRPPHTSLDHTPDRVPNAQEKPSALIPSQLDNGRLASTTPRPHEPMLDGKPDSTAFPAGTAGALPQAAGASHDALREKELLSPASTQQTVPVSVTPATDVDMDEAPEEPKPDGGLIPSIQDGVSPSAETVAGAQITATGASLSTPDASKRPQGELTSTPIAAIPSKATDQPLSPASSRGHLSSTSSVTEKTPATSPAKEPEPQNEPVPPSKIPESIPPPIENLPTPRRAPLTPDEQLKFEAAQSSMQQAAEYPVKPAPAPGPSFSSYKFVPENPFAAQKKSPLDANKPQALIPQKPPGVNGSLRLDTTRANADALPKRDESRSAPTVVGQSESATASPLSSTTRKTPATSVPLQAHFQPERMTTRVSSGAIRHRSVSEILGETPKSVADKADKPLESPTGTSDGEKTPTRRLKDRKEKERSKLSTVVFPKQQPAAGNETTDLVRSPTSPNEDKDYLYTLFQAKAHYPPRSMHLSALLSTAHKTLTTANHFVDYHEQMDCRSLKRIYQLQHANRWPLRQLRRQPEPPRQASHWDILLDHMKWMRMDFREERKWKIAAAKRCADWCAEYVASDPDQRAEMRVKVQPPPPVDVLDETGAQDERDDLVPPSQPTPDLISSTEEDSVSEGFNDEIHTEFPDGVVPAAIFSLGSDEFNFGMERTPALEKILEELPLYSPVAISRETNLPQFKASPDEVWRKELLPVSKYATGTIKFVGGEPPRKRSRYDYYDSDDDDDVDSIDVSPDQRDVALFQPENRHIRDRIHPGHTFRPPTEYPMPSVGFFESRQSSQWTYTEDDELRRLVKDYSYNWSLISSCLSSSSSFICGADRRTPWECFERWIGLEGLPPDLAKTPYFRAYSSRLDAAQRSVLAAQQQAMQQQQQSQSQSQQGGMPTPVPQALVRRRTTQPVRVERKRSSRHLALLDGMRKLSKKREVVLQKQQQATHHASTRKINEATQPRPHISTPAEFSRLKHERDLKLQESQEQYKQAMMAQRMALAQRAAQQQQQQQQHRQMPNQQLLNGMPRNPAAPNGVVPGIAAPPVGSSMPNGLPVNTAMAQARAHPGITMPNGAPVNAGMPNGAMGLKMMQQQGMQAMNSRPGPGIPQGSPDNARIIREANRVQEEQQRMVQSRQQQLQGQQSFIPQGPHSSPNMNMGNMNTNPNNPTMLAFQAASGVNSPSFHTPSLAQGVSTASPRMNHTNPLSNPGIPSLSSIQASIQRSNPSMPAEQVNKLAADRHHQIQQQRMSQVAMNAVTGNMGAMQNNYQMSPHDGTANMHQLPPHTNMPNGAPSNIQTAQTQGYSPLMRVAQTGPPNRMGVNGSPAMNAMALQQSRSVTPQTHRSTSGQGGPGQMQGGAGQGTGPASVQGPGPGKSPRPPQAQMAS